MSHCTYPSNLSLSGKLYLLEAALFLRSTYPFYFLFPCVSPFLRITCRYGGLVVSRCLCSDMQIIRAATAKSDWRRCACDFAVADSPLHAKEKCSFVDGHGITWIHWYASQIDYWPRRGICLNVITPVNQKIRYFQISIKIVVSY